MRRAHGGGGGAAGEEVEEEARRGGSVWSVGGNTNEGGREPTVQRRAETEIDKSKLLLYAARQVPRQLLHIEEDQKEYNLLKMYEDDDYIPEEDTL